MATAMATPNPTSRKDKHGYPAPLIFGPSAPHVHTYSLILLHGRGSNADRFGLELLGSVHSSGKTLAQLFPSAKFIFPTAKKRRSTVLKRVPIHQWFDNFSLEDPARRPELQYEGLAETTAVVHTLLRAEVAAVGAANVVLGGLSQGCAMALHALLSFEATGDVGLGSDEGVGVGVKRGLGGFVGMSGWLPFRERILAEVTGAASVDDYNPFSDSSGTDDDDDNAASDAERASLRAANCVRDIADLPPLPTSPASGTTSAAPSFTQTPIFLGHGTADEKVSVRLGEQARDALAAVGSGRVTWRAYEGFGHWYKVPDEIDDVVEFLKGEVGWGIEGMREGVAQGSRGKTVAAGSGQS